MDKKEQNNKSKIIVSVLGLVLLLVFVVGITYAVFTYTKKGNIENTIRTGKITMSYREGENGITLENAYPMEDSVGKVLSDPNQIFDFTVNINLYGSKTPVSYEVTAEKNENSTLSDSDVRIYLEKSSDGTNYNAVSQPSGYVAMGEADEFGAQSAEMLLDRGNTTDTVTYNYRLRMWVGSNYQVSGEERHFTLKVNVYGNDGVNVEVNGVELDKSSATVKLTNSLQLNASTTPASPSDKTITWTSSDPRIATVTNTGLVETKGVGTTTITATASNGKSASASIKVEVDNPNIVGAYTYNEATCPTGREETCQPTTCLVSGTCPAGTIISYKVNENTIQDFYILHGDEDKLTLLSTYEVIPSIVWSLTNDRSTGPIPALQELEKFTNSWTNVLEVTYDDTTYGRSGCSYNGLACISDIYTLASRTVRARMISVPEAVQVGCTENINSCPSWMFTEGKFYWTMNATTGGCASCAWMIDGGSNPNSAHVGYYQAVQGGDFIGVRAVIEINI